MNSAISKLLALLLVLIMAGPVSLADAQRRRRPRRRAVRRPPVAAPVDPAPEADEQRLAQVDSGVLAESEEDSPTPSPTTENPPARRLNQAVEEERPDDGVPLQELQNDYTNLMDELVQLRSRASVIAGQLFTTRMRVVIVDESGDDSVLQKVRLTLDGAPIFQAGANELGEDEREAFEGALAPGFHVFGVELEQRQRANRDYRYTLRDDYRFEIRPSTRTELRLVIEDDSDVGEAFEDASDVEAEGEFEVRTEIEIEQVEVRAGQGQDG